MSALHIAVQNGHVEVVEALTHKMDKDDLNARDNVRPLSTNFCYYGDTLCYFVVRYDPTDFGH